MRFLAIRTTLVLTAFAAMLVSCSEPFAPEATAGTYVLSRVGSVPVNEYVIPGADSELRIEFDSVTLQPNGIARSHTRTSGWIVNPSTPHVSDVTQTMKWRRDGATVVLTSYCPPATTCAAMMRVRRMLFLDGALVDQVYGTEPSVYPRVPQPVTTS